MCANEILYYLQEHPPRYGPDRGSGGIFGLKYYRGVLYYTLAFEAESFFIDKNGVRLKYRFDQVGGPPVSGGDTYNAVDAVDDKIYFGGWVYAPAPTPKEKRGRDSFDFKSKYAHVHYYSIDENKVNLVWKESIGQLDRWVGEVSEIIYNPVRNELLLARGNGQENLGIYTLDPKGKNPQQIFGDPVLKGSIVLDYACFATYGDRQLSNGFACVDLYDNRVHSIGIANKVRSIDNGSIDKPYTGPTASIYGRLFAFARGGVFILDALEPEKNPIYFVRLMDIPDSQYCSLRVNAKVIGGGVLTAFNSFTHGTVKVFNEESRRAKKYLNTIFAPTTLIYLKPPVVKIIATLGARVTSVETICDKIIVATNTMANTGRFDATPMDQGVRSFVIMDQSILYGENELFTAVIPGWYIRDRVFGGIPLNGYSEAQIIVNAKKNNTLYINEYFLTLPPTSMGSDKVDVTEGRFVLNLDSYKGIVSFRFEKPLLDDETVVISLN
ncbi:MAG: DUF2139 domain-containing protein [Desulfurococcaceae archaeon]